MNARETEKISAAAVLAITLAFLPLFPVSAETPQVPAVNKLSLAEAVITALKNNPSLDSMEKAVKRSEYVHSATAKEWLPTISTDYNFTGFPRKIYLEDNTGDNPNGEIPLVERTSLMWGVHARMPIYTSGALKNKRTITKLGVDVAKMRFLEAKVDLIQEVTIDYLAILRAQHYVDVAKEDLARYEKHEDVTEKYFNADKVAKNALLEVKVKRANAQQDLIEAGKDLKIAKAALNVTMGIDINSEFELEDVSLKDGLGHSMEECFDIAKKQNPSLVAFTYLKSRAQQVISLEKTAALPMIKGDFSYYRHGKTPALSGDDYITNDILMGTVVLEWTVFDWFRTYDRARAAKQQLEILIDNQKTLEDRISLDIRDAYLSMEAAKSKFEVAQKKIEHAKENYRISKARFEQMVAKTTEVNDSLALLKRSQFDYYSATFEYNVAVARLERIIASGLEAGGEALKSS